MHIYHGSQDVPRDAGPFAVAIGIFDGVHRGHQELLRTAVTLAAGDGLRSLAYTFDPHPVRVLKPELAPVQIEPVRKRLERFAALGLSAALVEPFTRELAATSAESFVRDNLVGRLRARHVIVGADFTFGNKQRGTVELLHAMGAELGFVTHPIPTVRIDGIVASSTKVREFVHSGQMQGAALLLGRPFSIDGTVVRGAGRGRTLGIPTANIETTYALVPAVGVYACRVQGAFGEHAAVTNVGYSPTFDERRLRIEAHLLDYTGGDLYGEGLSVAFIEKLRDEQRFDGPEALLRQIQADIVAARRLLDL